MFRKFLFALPVALVATIAQGGTISYVGDIVEQTTELADTPFTPSLLKFDGSLGTLTSVKVTLSGFGNTRFNVTNNSVQSQLFKATTTVNFFLSSSDAAINALVGALTLATSGGMPGFESIGSGATQLYGPYSLASASDQTYTSAGDLALFTGSGDLGFLVSTLSGYALTGGGGNLSFVQSTFAGAKVTVEYTFDAAVVPEPASVMMMGMGSLAGLGVIAARRRKVQA